MTSLILLTHPFTNLWYELKNSIREKRPDGQTNEVGQHFGEIRLLDERDEQETKQGCQVDHSNGQKPITPHCHGTKRKEKVLENSRFLLLSGLLNAASIPPTYLLKWGLAM